MYICHMKDLFKFFFLFGLFWVGNGGHQAQAQAFFKTNDFKVLAEDLNMNGSAAVIDDILRLTPARQNQRASCWYNRRKIDLNKGFETEFTFKIHANDAANGGGDGFAFVLHNQGLSAIGGIGNELGYKSIPNAVVIEFDTHIDEGDKTRNQVALMRYNQKTGSYDREATVHEIRELNNGQEHFARIEYKEGFLTFYMDSYLFPVLSYKIDIAERIGASDEKAIIGFTSSTGEAYSHHDILSWSLGEFLPPPEDIKEAEVQVLDGEVIEVKSRNLVISVWDHNRIDDDVISLKVNDKYILTKFTLGAIRKSINYRLTGFRAQLILYAHNLGEIPPNTAAIEIDDGVDKHIIKLKATLQQSESLILQYVGDDM